jgi:hypothetical protein
MKLCLRSCIPASSKARQWSLLGMLLAILLFTGLAHAQSTYGSFVGTVKDPSGSVVVGVSVTLINTGTAASRSVVTDATGTYSFLNADAGNYRIEVRASGFENAVYPGLVLQARETQRVEVSLVVGSQAETVTVEAAAAVINVDTPNLAETRNGLELNELPLAISSRAGGSTSPYATLTSQAGVQTDGTGSISIAGAKPSLLSVTIDGISTMNVRSSAPSTEMFPSFNSIEEIRISENANAAEFGGISDITTVSKGGTNHSHGGVFDNYESAGLNAKSPFDTVKPKLVMNDFGMFYSGPISVPRLYSGKDRTFYFLSYEGLRLPQQSGIIQSVPSVAMRNGDLSATTTGQIYDADGTPFANNFIDPSKFSSVSAAALKLLYPAPNYGDTGAIVNNYHENFATPISSDQGDARIDQTITSRQSVYARYSYKQRAVSQAPTSSAGSALIGAFNKPEKDTSLSAAYNYVITPNLINELRGGLSKYITETTFNATSDLIGELGITGIPDLLSNAVAAAPNFVIKGLASTAGTGSSKGSSHIYQVLDNLTWTKEKHTLKFGGDYRRIMNFSSNVFGSSRLGRYTFNGGSSVGGTINSPFASFLLGYPDSDRVADVLAPDLNGVGNAYAVFAQDDWKVSPSLTLSFGLRYEWHPVMIDSKENSAQLLPDYYSNIDGVNVRGAVVIPGEYAAQHNVLDSFVQGIAPMPILTARQAGIDKGLVYVSRDDFAPRIGFAWRPFHNDKTVFRGGFGRFIATALGGNVIGGWAVSGSAVNNYSNSYASNGKPVLSFPAPFGGNAASTAGSLDFDYAVTPHYKDPTVQQWNLTVEQDIGFNTGIRVSYAGNHGQDLAEEPDFNQLPFNTAGYDALYPTRPFTEYSTIEDVLNLGESNYNAVIIEANHRQSHGLQFQTSYTFLRNLSDEAGANPTSFTSETGTYPSDRFHPGVDYGNVEYSRRHRFLGSFLYDLPFGHGKPYASTLNPVLDRGVGGWQLAGYVLAQSGPFMTILSTSDPTGTGITLNTVGYSRADVVSGQSVRAKGQGNTVFLNPAAFASADDNLGRQGTSGAGSVVGAGTASVSASLMKSLAFTERFNLQVGAQVQNLLNHRNFDVPGSLVVGDDNFGVISSIQSKDNAGMRAVALTARFTF